MDGIRSYKYTFKVRVRSVRELEIKNESERSSSWEKRAACIDRTYKEHSARKASRVIVSG